MALCAAAEVLFDVDRGHEVQYVFPPNALTPEELSDVAFSAFPDSLSLELRGGSSVRDSSFCLCLRRRPAAASAPPPPSAFLYGHAFCRQRQDDRLRRGCEQRSVVLLSHLPLLPLLEQAARLVGPAVLSYGPAALRGAVEEAQRWPPLEWGCRVELPLLGVEAVRAELPLLTALPGSALPAAVGATLGLHLPPGQPGQQQQQQEAEYGAAGGRGGAAGSSSSSLATGAAPVGGEAAANGSLPPASFAACSEGVGGAKSDGGADGAAAAALGPAAASPAQVAAALAAELDGCDGVPLCLLPQAYGRQELAASPFGAADCFTPLRGSLPQLWALWELLLVGEPLMVVAPSPGACSGCVAALLSLLAPFPYSLDFRPFMTIHDPAFAPLAAGAPPTPASGLPLLLGTTNAFFLKALPAWPNVLSTGHTAATVPPSSNSQPLQEGGGGSSSALARSGPALPPPPARPTSRLRSLLRRRPAGPAALLDEPLDHCWLGYKPLSRPDSRLLAQLAQPEQSDPADRWRRVAAANSGLLRRHFQELTKALLLPLLPYFTPALPPPPASQASDPRGPPLEPPPLPVFEPAAALAQLSAPDAALPPMLAERFGGRGGLLAFYARFLRSPNLVAFLRLRRLAAEEWQRQEWVAAAAAARAPTAELLSVQSFHQLEQQLAAARRHLCGSDGSCTPGDVNPEALMQELEEKLRLAFSQLPEDLQETVLRTPSHAALLGKQQQPQRRHSCD